MKQKYASTVEVKLSTRPARSRGDDETCQELIPMGLGAKEILDGIIKEMAKYKPEALELYEVAPRVAR